MLFTKVTKVIIIISCNNNNNRGSSNNDNTKGAGAAAVLEALRRRRRDGWAACYVRRSPSAPHSRALYPSTFSPLWSVGFVLWRRSSLSVVHALRRLTPPDHEPWVYLRRGNEDASKAPLVR